MFHRARQIATHPVVKASYLVLLLITTVFYLASWGQHLPDRLRQVRLDWVVAALAVTYLSGALYSYIQYVIYRRLGAHITFWTVFRIVTISQLGKYLPGKVLFFGNFYFFSREAGITNLQIGANLTLSMALWLLTAVLCSLPVLELLQPALRYSVLILPLFLVILVHPRFLGWLLDIARQFSRRQRDSTQPDLLSELDAAFYLQVAFLYLATWGLAGLGAYCCLAALVPADLGTYPLVLASIALGTVGGFLVLFAPVGLGVREGIGTLVLSPAVGADAALLVMLLVRGVAVAVDLSLAIVSMVMGIYQRD
jgi:uncharacterized membrane protein YbhN (UPF0104 family)